MSPALNETHRPRRRHTWSDCVCRAT